MPSGTHVPVDASAGSNHLLPDLPRSQPMISATSKGSRYQVNGPVNAGLDSMSAAGSPLPNGYDAHLLKESPLIPARSHTNSTSSAASSYASTTEPLVTVIEPKPDFCESTPPYPAPTTVNPQEEKQKSSPGSKKHTTLRSLLSEPPKTNSDGEAYNLSSTATESPSQASNEDSYPSVITEEPPCNVAGDASVGESPSHNAYDIQKPTTKEALKIVLTKKSRQRKNKDKHQVKTEEPQGIPSNGLDLSYSTWNLPNSDVENSPSKSSAKERVGSPKGHNVCPICYRKFDYRSSFRRHMRIHEGVYSHQCAVCGRKFTRKEHFDRHKCSRRPNKPSRSADGNECSPEKRIKVAYPPTAAMEGISNGGHSTDDHDNSFDNEHSEAMLDDSMYFEKEDRAAALQDKIAPTGEDVDSMDEGRSVGGESRRKKSKPRKAVSQQDEEDLEAFYRTQHTPKSSPNDHSDVDSQASPLPLDQEEKPVDLSDPGNVPSPILDAVGLARANVKAEVPDRLKEYIEMSPGYNMSEDESFSDPGTPTNGTMDEFTLDTGSYKVSEEDMIKLEGCDSIETNSHGKFIKVTKQGKYLKLKNEVQVIDGHLCFVCPNCGKVFHRSSNFSRHMRIHRGVYSYLCPTCHRGFFRKEHFQKHKCHRKSMSHIWERKTKLDMVLKPKNDHLDNSNLKMPPSDCEESMIGREDENEDGSDCLYIDETPHADRATTPSEA